MNLQETAKELNNLFKLEKEKNLGTKIEQLEKAIVNLLDRIEYLEKNLK